VRLATPLRRYPPSVPDRHPLTTSIAEKLTEVHVVEAPKPPNPNIDHWDSPPLIRRLTRRRLAPSPTSATTSLIRRHLLSAPLQSEA
jgi:hypothetical protein